MSEVIMKIEELAHTIYDFNKPWIKTEEMITGVSDAYNIKEEKLQQPIKDFRSNKINLESLCTIIVQIYQKQIEDYEKAVKDLSNMIIGAAKEPPTRIKLNNSVLSSQQLPLAPHAMAGILNRTVSLEHAILREYSELIFTGSYFGILTGGVVTHSSTSNNPQDKVPTIYNRNTKEAIYLYDTMKTYNRIYTDQSDRSIDGEHVQQVPLERSGYEIMDQDIRNYMDLHLIAVQPVIIKEVYF